MMFARLRRRLFHGSKHILEYDGKHWDLTRGCPDCGGDNFFAGPEGGSCTNICCANPECRSAFNWCLSLVERIMNTTFRSAFPDNPTESEAYLNANKTQLG